MVSRKLKSLLVGAFFILGLSLGVAWSGDASAVATLTLREHGGTLSADGSTYTCILYDSTGVQWGRAVWTFSGGNLVKIAMQKNVSVNYWYVNYQDAIVVSPKMMNQSIVYHVGDPAPAIAPKFGGNPQLIAIEPEDVMVIGKNLGSYGNYTQYDNLYYRCLHEFIDGKPGKCRNCAFILSDAPIN